MFRGRLEVKLVTFLFLVCGIFGVVAGSLLLRSQERKALATVEHRMQTLTADHAKDFQRLLNIKTAAASAANKLVLQAITGASAVGERSVYEYDKDRALRSKPKDGSSGAFLSCRSRLTPRIEQYMAATETLWRTLGPLVRSDFFNLYVIT